jgi:type VI secretion system protein ImpH
MSANAPLPGEAEADLVAHPWRHGFFQTLRRFEAARPDLPRLGTSERLADDPVRIGQSPSLAFAPATIAAVRLDGPPGPPQLEVRFFGLWGPNGPMPLHLTELARERQRRTPADGALVRFADVFHHRLASMLYRAWAEAQPAVSADRSRDPAADTFGCRLDALAGTTPPTLAPSGDFPRDTGRALTAWLGGGVRTAEGARRVLSALLSAPVRVHERRLQWFAIPDADRLRLGARPKRKAASGAVLGSRLRDALTGVTVEIGPLSIGDYLALAPGGARSTRLKAAARLALGITISCECCLILRAHDVPSLRLGHRGPTPTGQLGRTAWLGRRSQGDAADLRWRTS